MEFTASTLFYIITGVIFISYVLGLYISLKRTQVRGKPQVQRFLAGIGFMVVWFLVNFLLGQSEWLARFDRLPPPFLFYFLSILVTSFAFTFSPLGTLLAKGLEYHELIGFQSFRVLVEIGLVMAAKEGLAPESMTLQGWNYDIVTGVSALVLAFYFPRFPNYRYVKVWNGMGLMFLFIVVFTGFFSFPAPWRIFMSEPSNIWITGWPYILLPGLFVWSAFITHLLIRKKLQLDPKTFNH